MTCLAVITGLLAAFALTACTTALPVRVQPPASIVLVEAGALTEEGTRKRNAGLRHVAADRNGDAFAEWLPLAMAGHAASQYDLGLMTRQGLGTAVDASASLEWTRRAAQADHPPALLELGRRHAHGSHGAQQDLAEATRLFLRGAALGDVGAAYHAGRNLFLGDGTTKETARGIALLTEAAQAETPSVQAQSMLGMIYLKGDTVPPDDVQARHWIELAAAAEDPTAQFAMGLLNQSGRAGKPKNLHKALGWYLRAAQQGNAAALNSIGLLYQHGEGVRKNLALARQRFEEAHTRGNLDATVNLGKLLFNTNPASPERIQAVALYRLAAEAEHGDGQCRYARALQAGVGVARDLAAAAYWQTRARQSGSACHTGLAARTRG